MEDDRKMFIGGLHPDTHSSVVTEYFKKYGAIEDIRIIGEEKRKSRGYGFITFFEKATLDTILREENHKIDGHYVDVHNAAENKKRINNSDPSRKLYVSKIPIVIGKIELQKFFEKFGKIKEILLVFRKNKDKAFSFIEFEQKESVDRALAQPNYLREEYHVCCERALPKDQDGNTIMPESTETTKNVNGNMMINDSNMDEESSEEISPLIPNRIPRDNNIETFPESPHTIAIRRASNREPMSFGEIPPNDPNSLAVRVHPVEQAGEDESNNSSYCSITKKISREAKEKSRNSSFNDEAVKDGQNLRFNQN